ncbi:hypothetical protein EVAR_19973_1 [Eumeta japonica]|uniref:Uncharacterized protein n=1 Tax=Eumeta variegata TaxID=151549 RepID=A0A4C1V9S0_EUMVA|nr:hypothetical protein EVAR_19973_1 [Eumeta japonica]
MTAFMRTSSGQDWSNAPIFSLCEKGGKKEKNHYGPSMRPDTRVCPTRTDLKPPEQLMAAMSKARGYDAFI